MQNNNERPKKYYIGCTVCDAKPAVLIFHQPTACYFCIEHFQYSVPGEYDHLEAWVCDHYLDGVHHD